MVTETFKAEAASAYGNELKEVINYEYTVNLVQTLAEVPAEEQPSAKDLVTLVNNKRKANERQKQMLIAFDKAGIKAPKVDATPDGILFAAKNTVKTLVATGKSEDEAKQMAAVLFGVSAESL